VGWVIPMVLMKAFAMKRRNFMFLRRGIGEIVAGIEDGKVCIYLMGLA
jgi:hypothetical protein